jgi:hypothetical protein
MQATDKVPEDKAPRSAAYFENGRLVAMCLLAGSILFMLAMGVSMACYPGGHGWSPAAAGYDFWRNFWCDLLAPITRAGDRNNFYSMLFAMLGTLAFAIGSIPLWYCFKQLIPGSPRLGMIIRVCGLAAVFGRAVFTACTEHIVHGTIRLAGRLAGCVCTGKTLPGAHGYPCWLGHDPDDSYQLSALCSRTLPGWQHVGRTAHNPEDRYTCNDTVVPEYGLAVHATVAGFPRGKHRQQLNPATAGSRFSHRRPDHWASRPISPQYLPPPAFRTNLKCVLANFRGVTGMKHIYSNICKNCTAKVLARLALAVPVVMAIAACSPGY